MTSNDRNLVTLKKPGTFFLMQNVDLGHTKVDDTSYVSNCGIVTMTKKSVSSVLKFLHNKRSPDSIAKPNLDLGRSHSLIKSLSNYYFF